ncbi:MAG: glycoside hydrolase family 3 N-terminal domain-containing protein [Chloroflexota bacterium]
MKAPNLEALLARLTLDEKLAQVGSAWMHELLSGRDLDLATLARKCKHGIGQITRVAGDSTLDPVSAARAANAIQKFLVEGTNSRIPAILHEECCSGAMILGGTMYPQMLGLASAFQPELAEAMTRAIRKQLRAIGARQGLAPVLDLARDARWGRCEETFGEDPLLVSHFGMAYIKGLQGESLKEGVMATGKHFVAHSLSQGGLNCGPVHIGVRDLYDAYLIPFEAAIREAGLAAIMNAYPELDGEVVAASRRILTNLLRERLGFDGVVVSDYEAVMMIHTYHRVASSLSEAARLALEAGIDVELPTTLYYGDPLRAALEAGDLSLETLDLAARRHLQKKNELGLFENPYVDEGRVLEVFETAEPRSLARTIARQSMVLLKNDGLLPLEKTINTLAVIGPNADDARNLLGDYSYAATFELTRSMSPADSYLAQLDPASLNPHQVRVITVLDGIKSIASPQTKVIYAKGCSVPGGDDSGFEEAISAAKRSEAVILVLGDKSGLTPDCTSGETRDSSDLRLPGMQEDLARALLATGKPVVVVLINGRPLAIPLLAERANAILEAWLPGEEGGAAVAETLFGLNNPGGKLAMTFPRSAGQVPIYYNHKPSGMRSNWYVDYVNEPVTPLYPFGHGVSYTAFEYSDLSIERDQARGGEVVNIACKVANTGEVRGDEVVQLYLCDVYASFPRPVKELKGYARVSLDPGESKTVTFHLPVDMLAFHDADLNLILEPGRIEAMIGSSSEDIRLRAGFEIVGDVVEVEKRIFVCPVTIE